MDELILAFCYFYVLGPAAVLVRWLKLRAQNPHRKSTWVPFQ